MATKLHAWGAIEGDGARDQVADAVLITSELVSNAVRFSVGRLGVDLTATEDHIDIAVTDDDLRLASLQHPDLSTPGGRGLVLVDALAGQWGQHRHGRQKTVWATLPLAPGSDRGRGRTS